jgi:hypothetical protein
MTHIDTAFRCKNCCNEHSAADRARFSLWFRIATLPTAIFWFVPSLIVWPRDVCRRCASQVGLTAVFFILLSYGLLACWLVSWLRGT